MTTLIDAEQAGKDFFRDHPQADRATVEQVARNKYASVLWREWFVAG